MDGDLQDSPEDIPALYEMARRDEYDIVVARRAQQDVSATKKTSSQLFNWALSWLGGIETSQRIGNFRIFSRQVADALLLCREQSRFFSALMARLGFKVGFLDVRRLGSREGISTYKFGKLVRLATDAIIANSEKPLWLGIYLGLVISSIGFSMALWALLEKLLYNSPVQGWTSIFIAVTFFSGVQLLCSGLIGVYVGRIFHETKGRPIYIVAQFLDPQHKRVGQARARKHRS
jgi:dolichol-phosphate mannosyltransferase